MSEDAGIEPRTVNDFGIGSQTLVTSYLARSRPYSARTNPHSARSLPHSARSHPHSATSLPNSARSRPYSARKNQQFHIRLDLVPTRLDLIHHGRQELLSCELLTILAEGILYLYTQTTVTSQITRGGPCHYSGRPMPSLWPLHTSIIGERMQWFLTSGVKNSATSAPCIMHNRH